MTRTGNQERTGQNSIYQEEDPSPEDTKESPDQTNKRSIEQDGDKIFPIVGIGASAGGLEALQKFFTNMPQNSGMAFILVLHLDPSHKSIMGDILKKNIQMEIFQAEDGMKVDQNCVYIIPPNKDMAILNGTLQLLEPVVYQGIRHPIDFFFRSLAEDLKEHAICIILSGTGTEGTQGLKAINGESGMVMVQDPKSAAFDSMPRSAIATGLVDYVLPPEEMAEQLIDYIKKGVVKTTEIISESAINSMQKIILLIRNKTGHDFSFYKPSTINRRIAKRMNIHQIEKLTDYVRYLQEDPSEVELLFKELLINVTTFFRDPEAFEVLKAKVMEDIIENKTGDQPIRIWVPACSTGEEPFSIAMVFKEYLDEMKSDLKVQIFATDIDKDAIETAREGIYPANIAVDVSEKRLEQFFLKTDEMYTIKKEIREMVTFAPQNVIKDPPFSKLDLICCRNLLIYLTSELQGKILTVFHRSLNQDGILFLGTSETIGRFTELYSLVDSKWKFYKRKGGTYPLKGDFAHITASEEVTPVIESKAKLKELDIGEETERMLLEDYSPACVIVNESGDILYIHGKTGKYLEPSSGKASFNIMEMARDGLKIELNIAIYKAINQEEDVFYKDLNVRTNGDIQTIDLIVKPISDPKTMKGLIMVIFRDVPTPEQPVIVTHEPADISERIAQLEHELNSSKKHHQNTIEELRASNEELKSSNEELQSTNEELETSREELQSVNEELMTVNTELQIKNEEFSRSVDDMNNLLASTEIATIFLDAELCIEGFTPSATKIMNLLKTDIGRPVSDMVLNMEYDNLVIDSKEVLETLVFKEQEIRDKNGVWYLMKILPYRTQDNIIAGVVISFININEQKRAEQMESDARIFSENIVNTVRESLLVLDKDLRVISANQSFYQNFQVAPEDTENQYIYEIGNRQWDIPKLRTFLEEVLPQNTQFNNFEVDHTFPIIGYRKMLLNGRQVLKDGTGTEMILLAIDDIKE